MEEDIGGANCVGGGEAALRGDTEVQLGYPSLIAFLLVSIFLHSPCTFWNPIR